VSDTRPEDCQLQQNAQFSSFFARSDFEKVPFSFGTFLFGTKKKSTRDAGQIAWAVGSKQIAARCIFIKSAREAWLIGHHDKLSLIYRTLVIANS